MIGQKFGSWTVLTELGVVNKKRRVLCACACGKERSIAVTTLRTATHCLSCARSKNPSRKIGEFHCALPEYRVWSGMRNRCKDTSDPSYGGKGIRVCDRWNSSFEAFMVDMGRRPSDQHSIDRINNDGNYEPGNCRWATMTEQNRNRSDSALVDFRGVVRNKSVWAAELGVSPALLDWRLRAWGKEKALTTVGVTPMEQWNWKASALTEEQVADAMHRLRSGETGRSVAKLLGVSPSLVSNLKLGKIKSRPVKP